MSYVKQPVESAACKACGKVFLRKTRKNRRGYCSSKCRGATAWDSSERTCRQCTSKFHPMFRRHIFCSKECGATYHYLNGGPASNCKWCGECFIPKSGKNAGKYCSRGCAFASASWRTRVQSIADGCLEWLAKSTTASTCRICGGMFRASECQKTCANPECRDEHVRRYMRVYQSNRYHKSVTYRGVGNPQPSFSRVDVLNRDGWTCKLCGEAISDNYRWPHPMSPEVDHIIPIARGGQHVLSNVQAAHRKCNASKGVSVDFLGL